ncbi:superoxide dismutase family protein [Paracoccus albus]|uniref:superoxide dismutase family protein n=1 Tax=Paracoccus albus TaxID=3017784 RepID=UPI0022F144B7|nr:superoxide dismutase family protein [Paracoccus albus]WBU61499.1 superoxide dismutase family protein [Paracoccus albus]
MRFQNQFIAALTSTALFGAGIAYAQDDETPAADDTAPAESDALPATSATIADAEGNQIGGIEVAFTESGMARVNLSLTGIATGNHAVHFHETGLCEAPFESAGGHLADGMEHGVNSPNGPHPGDMPNVTVPEGGALALTYFVPNLTSELVQDTDGTAFIIHEGEDDYMSQPSGEAGGRLGCAVIAPPAA